MDIEKDIPKEIREKAQKIIDNPSEYLERSYGTPIRSYAGSNEPRIARGNIVYSSGFINLKVIKDLIKDDDLFSELMITLFNDGLVNIEEVNVPELKMHVTATAEDNEKNDGLAKKLDCDECGGTKKVIDIELSNKYPPAPTFTLQLYADNSRPLCPWVYKKCSKCG